MQSWAKNTPFRNKTECIKKKDFLSTIKSLHFFFFLIKKTNKEQLVDLTSASLTSVSFLYCTFREVGMSCFLYGTTSEMSQSLYTTHTEKNFIWKYFKIGSFCVKPEQSAASEE